MQSYVALGGQANEPASGGKIKTAMRKVTPWLPSMALAVVALLGVPQRAVPMAAPEVIETTDLQADGRVAMAAGIPVLLVFKAAHCPYCRELEESFLRPMLISGDYDTKVMIRSVDLDHDVFIQDFQGESVTPRGLAERYGVGLTPTMLLVDAGGRELVPRLVGLGVIDFFAAEIDAAIEAAAAKLAAGGQ
jgi:thioredoxin-related protein